MARPFSPKVVTANHLLEGDVIYLAPDASWVRKLHEAQLFTDETLAQFALENAAKQADIVVGAYLADATEGPNGPEPVHFKEDFRRTGPSNYAHGKQVELANV